MQIIINKKSWHYRWYRFLHDKCSENYWSGDPVSVCSYFWGFMFNNAKAIFLSLIALFLVVLLTVPIWGSILYQFNGNKDLLNGVYLFLGVYSSIGLLIGFYILKDKYKNIDSGFIRITKSALGSIKDKVCPLIEYKD